MLSSGKVLVTGADGFIGSHLTEELVRRGYSVRAMVLYNSFNSWGWLEALPAHILNEIEVFSGDIRNSDSVRQAVKGCKVILHLAALIAIPYSYISPESYIATNVTGTLNILQAAKDLNVEKLVHTSTSEVYGSAQFVPISEDHPLQPQSPYSASKIGADHLALSFYYSYNLPVSIVRPFNTYGPRQSARAVIPTIISQIASGKAEIQLGALEPTRDFNYVRDTVSGFIVATESDNSLGEIINLGTNYEISIGQVVEVISELMGAEIAVTTDPNRLRPISSEVDRLCADNTKARNLLGWKPAFTGPEGLRQGLTETIEWFTDPQNLMKYKTGVYNL